MRAFLVIVGFGLMMLGFALMPPMPWYVGITVGLCLIYGILILHEACR